MSPSVGYEDDMGAFGRLDDGELEELLSGHPPADDEGLENLVAFIADLRATSGDEVRQRQAERHVALAARAAEVSAGTPRPVRQRHRTVFKLRERRRIVLSSVLSSLVAKVLAGSVALAAATGGAAAAGVLPDPVQRFVADTAQEIGVDLPRPEDAEPTPPGGLPEEAVEGQAEAARKRAAAKAYAEAIQDWTACVAENAAGQGDPERRQQDPFDPTVGCGEKPDPADFGLTEPPEGTPQGPPEGTPQGPPGPQGPPEGAPQGPPEGAPQGRP